jgi:hypothetical protein
MGGLFAAICSHPVRFFDFPGDHRRAWGSPRFLAICALRKSLFSLPSEQYATYFLDLKMQGFQE